MIEINSQDYITAIEKLYQLQERAIMTPAVDNLSIGVRPLDHGYTYEMFLVDISLFVEKMEKDFYNRSLERLLKIGYTRGEALSSLRYYPKYRELYDYGFYASDAVEFVAVRVLARYYKPKISRLKRRYEDKNMFNLRK